MTRPLATLPKAHLHLHFTGAMRHPTLVELAAERRIHLPEALAAAWPPRLRGTDERGWFRFQRLYDIARSVLTDEPALFRLLRETAQDEKADGSSVSTERAMSYSRWNRNQPRSSVPLSRGGQAAASASGRWIRRSAASSTSVGWRIAPVKCRCRCALGSVASGRVMRCVKPGYLASASSLPTRVTPSSRSASPRAQDSRKYPGVPNASPGTTATSA